MVLPHTHKLEWGRVSRQKVRCQVSKFWMPSYENLGVGVPSLSSRQEVRSWHPKFEVVSFENIQCDAQHHDDHDFRSSLPRPPPPSTAIGVRNLFQKLMNSIASLIWGYFSIICRLNKIFRAESIARLCRITIDIADIGSTTISKLTFKYILLSLWLIVDIRLLSTSKASGNAAPHRQRRRNTVRRRATQIDIWMPSARRYPPPTRQLHHHTIPLLLCILLLS